MPRALPAIVVAPGIAFSSPSLTAESKVVLATVLTLADPEDMTCRVDVPAIAAACGMKPKITRQALNALIDQGWVVEIPNGKTSYMGLFVRDEVGQREVEPKTPDKIFDKTNLVVDDKEVVHLITVFLESGLNPKLKGKIAEKKSYGSTWQRHGAHKLLTKYGIEVTKKMIADIAPHRADPYCPKIDSLNMLDDKWEKCQNFLRINVSKGMTHID